MMFIPTVYLFVCLFFSLRYLPSMSVSCVVLIYLRFKYQSDKIRRGIALHYVPVDWSDWQPQYCPILYCTNLF